ncbi:MAG TPA: hypothetical protein PLU39_17250 [Armatimonadota bacterium]|nr:hypothetical protein [Armatimonadota bacterium]HOM80238.1 hypothetical protein [Armatimonadota bacterium]HPO72141.1 hypothetical protein [Armatimonadota bacterium]HPT99611.1 hypothetical protein [Armatimonadota bacterium]
MRWTLDDTRCRPGRVFRVPNDGGVLLRHFAGRRARIDEITETRSGKIVTFTVAGVRVSCPLAYLDRALQRESSEGD